MRQGHILEGRKGSAMRKITLTLVALLCSACGANGLRYYELTDQGNQREISSSEICDRVARLNETGGTLHVRIYDYDDGVPSQLEGYRFLPDAQYGPVSHLQRDFYASFQTCSVEVVDNVTTVRGI